MEMLADPEVARLRPLKRHILCRLADLPDQAAAWALLDAFQDDAGDDLRVLIAALLAKRSETEVEQVLVAALRDNDYRIRMHAARGLASASSESAATALVAALEDPDKGVRWDVVEALGWIGISRPEVIGPLTKALEDESRRVRLSAAKSLARLGARSALPAMRRLRDRSWPPWRFMISRYIETLDDRFV